MRHRVCRSPTSGITRHSVGAELCPAAAQAINNPVASRRINRIILLNAILTRVAEHDTRTARSNACARKAGLDYHYSGRRQFVPWFDLTSRAVTAAGPSTSQEHPDVSSSQRCPAFTDTYAGVPPWRRSIPAAVIRRAAGTRVEAIRIPAADLPRVPVSRSRGVVRAKRLTRKLPRSPLTRCRAS